MLTGKLLQGYHGIVTGWNSRLIVVCLVGVTAGSLPQLRQDITESG
jgi:hypothetical protein